MGLSIKHHMGARVGVHVWYPCPLGLPEAEPSCSPLTGSCSEQATEPRASQKLLMNESTLNRKTGTLYDLRIIP